MPFPDFLRSGEIIELHGRRRTPPFDSELESMGPPPPGRGDVLTRGAGDLLGGAGPLGRELDLSCEKQKGDNWCWAAVAASVARFYDPQVELEQCELANRFLQTDQCCGPNADMEICDRPQRLDKVLGITGNLVEFFHDATKPEPPISFETVRSEIDKGRVVCSRVSLSPRGGHFQMITGWKTAAGENYLIISDPIHERVEILFSSFGSRFNGAKQWNVAYITASSRTGGLLEGLEAPGEPLLASTESSRSTDDAIGAQHQAEVGDPADLFGG